MKKCPSPTGFFKVDNLFGELLTEAHKSIARKNLGIDKLPSGGTYGIPIVTESMENKPDKYIIIPDESDLSGSVENKTIVTTNNGTYIDILFSAIRSLQAEIARLKNTFYYGILSYTDEYTTSSLVIADKDQEETEPLWALDPEDLALVDEIYIDSTCLLTPREHYSIYEGVVDINDYSVIGLNTEEIEEPKIALYLIIDPKDNWETTITLSNDKIIKLHNMLPKLKCNVLVLINRKIEGIGKSYIWYSVTDIYNNVIKQGYGDNFSKNEVLESIDKYDIETLEFKNVKLYKGTLYSKEQSFSNEGDLPSSIPTTDDFTYKAAHLTIRSVKSKAVLEKISSRLLNNELIWVELENALYIKSNYKLISLSGGTINNDMTDEQILQWLKDNGLLTQQGDLNSAKLSEISGITFIHEDSGKRFNMKINSEGVLESTEIDSLLPDTGNLEDSILVKRGAVAYYNCKILNNVDYLTAKNSVISTITADGESITLGDRVRISSWYIPTKDQLQYNCSHEFIELTNCSSEDYPLNGVTLGVVKLDSEGKCYLDKFILDGYIKSGSTYLVRSKQYLELTSPIAHVKVDTYDKELWKNSELYELKGAIGLILFTDNAVEILNNKATKVMQSLSGDNYFQYVVHKNLIDVVGITKDILGECFQDGAANTWVKANYTTTENAIVKDLYLLDPAKQAFRSLSSSSETSNIRVEKVASEVIPLKEEFITFPHSSGKCPVSKYAPKASKQNKNISSDKTGLDINKPNMVNCSFGINGFTTRCFNWVSVGYYDEFIWIRKKGTLEWNKFESYKDEDNLKLSEGYPRRKEFSELLINCVYKRMSGNFPGNNYPYTAHKVILELESSPNLTYEYIVGRSNKNGTPNVEHCSEIYEFTLHDNTWTPIVYQTSDQQGFGWMEYQVWAAAATEVLAKINEECNDTTKCYPVFINTGDMTLNGTRVNEWLDYYNGGIDIFKKIEHMAVVGNNDLCNANGPQYLGTGDDVGKSNPYYFHLFYCYEIEESDSNGNWQHPLIYNNVYIPSTYYFHLGLNGYVMVNSELTETACKILYKAVDGDSTYNLYTGYKQNSSAPEIYSLKSTIESMIDSLSGKSILVACHEMPFTVINDIYLKDTTNVLFLELDRSLLYKDNSDAEHSSKSLIGSHLNRLSANADWDNDDNYWFSRLLETKGIRLCIGGHKHTYACTFPISEYSDNYSLYYTAENGFKTAVTDTKRCVIKRTGNTISGTVGKISGGTNYFNFLTDSNLQNGVTYFMLQATGYKVKSNKELPSPNQMFSKIVPKTDWTNPNKGGVDVSQEYPMYATIRNDSENYLVDLYRVANIKLESLKSNKTVLTEFSLLNYSTNPITSEKLLLKAVYSNGVLSHYDNFWMSNNKVENYTENIQRCYKLGSNIMSNGLIISDIENEEHTIVI